MIQPRVSVICLCYNHAAFVRAAIESVLQQTYSNIQIIVVDDASTDASVATIRDVIEGFPNVEFLPLEKNLGNCAAFNRGLQLADGKFVIDFATDDIMMPQRISRQVEFFQALDERYGVVFTDAEYIDEKGKVFRAHYDHLLKMNLISGVPQGDVYRDILTTYFISSPTMMVRKKVFDDIGGYDENLVYEDFDFWVRSSRDFRYAFLNDKLTQVRKLKKSMSTGWYVPGDRQLHSTYLVCKKANLLNRTKEDIDALIKRVRYELRQSVFSENHAESELFYRLLQNLRGVRIVDRFFYFLNTFRLPLGGLRKSYQRIRYGKLSLPESDLE